MIKSVTLQNFEAHEETTVEFGEGMNLIEGQSNAGKSSILRALKMVVDNDWDKDMVRNGYDFCRVKITTDRGWVEAERGEKVNRWKCQENGDEVKVFQKVGLTVPEVATKILGMGSRDRGNGIRELPNFQTQLEKHYMLAEVGEKKSTSNMIAVMMDNAIGLCGIEDIIKDFSSDLLRDRKWLNDKQSEILEIKSEILDDMVFEGIENIVSGISRIEEESVKMEDAISEASLYMDRYDSLQKRHAEKIQECDDCSVVDEISSGLSEAFVLKSKISIAEKAEFNSRRIDEVSKISEIDAESIENVLASAGMTMSVCKLAEKANSIEKSIRLLEDFDSIDDNSLQSAAFEANRLKERIAEAERILVEARKMWKKKTDCVKDLENTSREYEEAEVKFANLKKELGVCPLCGGELK